MVQGEIEESGPSAVGQANDIFVRIRQFTTDALRYWELRRLFYNLILGVIVAYHFIARWPNSGSLLSFDTILGLFILAVLANAAYSVVYIADVFIQLSGFRDSRRVWRWVLLVVGFAFAGVLAHFMSRGIFAAHNAH